MEDLLESIVDFGEGGHECAQLLVLELVHGVQYRELFAFELADLDRELLVAVLLLLVLLNGQLVHRSNLVHLPL